jgi:hypothetical protein
LEPEDRSIWIDSMLPSRKYLTVSTNLPYRSVALGRLRVIQVADPFHLDAPVLDILREGEFLGAHAPTNMRRGRFWYSSMLLVDARLQPAISRLRAARSTGAGVGLGGRVRLPAPASAPARCNPT